MPLSPSAELWTKLYEQHLLHARHVEIQRATYAGIFGGTTLAAVVGAAALFRCAPFLPAVFVALAGLAVFQTLVALKLGRAFSHFAERAEAMNAELPPAYRDFAWTRSGRGPHLGEILPWLYGLMAAFWLLIALAWAALPPAALGCP